MKSDKPSRRLSVTASITRTRLASYDGNAFFHSVGHASRPETGAVFFAPPVTGVRPPGGYYLVVVFQWLSCIVNCVAVLLLWLVR